MDAFLKELPKCEHHVHLEGTLSPELMYELAKKHNISLPDSFPKDPLQLYDRYERFADLQDFLDHYYIGMSVLKDQSDFEDLAWNYFVKANADGVVHAEVFFDPQAHIERGIDLDHVVKGFTSARERALKEFGMSTKLIMCILRHLPGEDGTKMVHHARPHFESGAITGLGLDSSEVGRPPELFTEAYNTLREFGLEGVNYTAHSGEEGGPDYITSALDNLKVERIDHGVRSVEDLAVLKRLAENKTLITVCPISNVKLRVFKSVSQLPLQKLLDHGVPFSLNSDDPAYFGGYILDNYNAVHEHFNFDIDTWCLIATNSVNGSWIDDKRKNELLEKIEAVKQKYVSV